MGVPGFYNYLIEKYPNIVFKILNAFKCEYLYLDMNGILHPCCHPEGSLKPKDEDEMIAFISKYLDMLFNFVQPSKLLFIAIDGPPPRAKMMQQRERRFIHEYEAKLSTSSDDDETWDSNVITPGTPFMAKVSRGLQQWIQRRLGSQSDGNKEGGLRILLSDASVPGEGEHKILDFIRNLRFRGEYDSSATHVLFSNDADMIFLGLLLHEANIYLMRDIPLKRNKRRTQTLFETQFNMLNFRRLTQYLAMDLSAQKIGYKHVAYDIDRVIDDFVFLSFLVGNDFVPCLPFMNMRDGAFEYLLQSYMQCASALPDYLTNGCALNVDALSVFFSKLAADEKDTLSFRANAFLQRAAQGNATHRGPATKKRKLNHGSPQLISDDGGENKLGIDRLRKASQADIEFIRFGEHGYARRYYVRRFASQVATVDVKPFTKQASMEYIRALSWIQHYYYTGVRSWEWFYPYHYAPLISDVTLTLKSPSSSSQMTTTDSLWPQTSGKGAPLTPLLQLSLVLPRTSAEHVLPACYFEAIFGTHSRLKRFFPDSFEMDLNFKTLNWEAIALMPEVDVPLLVKTLSGKDQELEAAFVPFTVFGHDMLFGAAADKDKDTLCLQQWAMNRVSAEDDDEPVAETEGVCCLKVDVLNVADAESIEKSKGHRKCQRTEDEDGDGDAVDDDDEARKKGNAINGADVAKVSAVLYKCFMTGKDKPQGSILKFLKKRPNFMVDSVDKLRHIFGRKNMKQTLVKKNASDMKRMQEVTKVNTNNNPKNQKKDFVARLKSIANQSNHASMTNASELMIENVIKNLAAKKPQKQEVEKEKIQQDRTETKKKIPTATPTIKTNFRPAKTVHYNYKNEPKHVNEKKIHKRKQKREKLKKMLKDGGQARIASAPKTIHLPLQINKPQTKKKHRNSKETAKAVSNERNSQLLEAEEWLNKRTSKKKKSAKKSAKKRNKNSKKKAETSVSG